MAANAGSMAGSRRAAEAGGRRPRLMKVRLQGRKNAAQPVRAIASLTRSGRNGVCLSRTPMAS